MKKIFDKQDKEDFKNAIALVIFLAALFSALTLGLILSFGIIFDYLQGVL